MSTQNAVKSSNREYRVFRLTPSSPTIGAVIDGIDLRQELDEVSQEELRRALAEWGVLFLPDQDITPDAQVRFGRIFGELREYKGSLPSLEGHLLVQVLEATETATETSTGDNQWHTDLSWQFQPAVATCLHSQVVPPIGGDTIWASMTAAYARLSPVMKELIADLRAVHTWEKALADYVRSGPDGEERYSQHREAHPPVEHDVVQSHPVTGQPLIYVNETFTTAIRGLPRDEGKALLDFLTGLAKVPELQVRHSWKPKTVVIWDNLAVQHYAVTDYHPHYRRLHRITIH